MDMVPKPLPITLATLRDEHRYMQLLLETMQERLQRGGLNSLSDYYLIQDISRYLHKYTDVVHHPTEDILFQRLVERDPTSQTDIDRLRQDHKKLESGTAKIRQLVAHAVTARTDEASEVACQAIESYTSRLHKHMEIEETMLFPRAAECLSRSDWKAIDARLSTVDDPLFGDTVEREFRPLYEYFARPSDKAARSLTKFGLLQFDNLIVSSAAVHEGVGAMLQLMSEHAGRLAAESRSVVKEVVGDPRPGTLIRAPVRCARFLGGQTLSFGKGAAGVYLRTARDAVLPFFKRGARRKAASGR